jgi:hypothetical protein
MTVAVITKRISYDSFIFSEDELVEFLDFVDQKVKEKYPEANFEITIVQRGYDRFSSNSLDEFKAELHSTSALKTIKTIELEYTFYEGHFSLDIDLNVESYNEAFEMRLRADDRAVVHGFAGSLGERLPVNKSWNAFAHKTWLFVILGIVGMAIVMAVTILFFGLEGDIAYFIGLPVFFGLMMSQVKIEKLYPKLVLQGSNKSRNNGRVLKKDLKKVGFGALALVGTLVLKQVFEALL